MNAPASPRLRAASQERHAHRGPEGVLRALAHDVLDACHFVRQGHTVTTFAWWHQHLARPMGLVAAGRAWDTWKADLRRFKFPHRIVGPDGLAVERGGEVALLLDVPGCERRASRLLVAAWVLRTFIHFPVEVVARQEAGDPLFGGVSEAEALRSARLLRSSACRAARRRFERREAALRATVGGWRTLARLVEAMPDEPWVDPWAEDVSHAG